MKQLARRQFAYTALLFGALVTMITFSGLVVAQEQPAAICDKTKQAFCFDTQIKQHTDLIYSINLPKIATPDWLTTSSAGVTAGAHTVSYSVATRGVVTADLTEFKQQTAETLNSPSGWSRLGVSFREVPEGGDFTLWLSQDIEVPSFSSSGCDSTYSCAVGRNVIINQTRWQHASDAWNGAGGGLRDYRSMVVNHEVGHWLGHGHRSCSGAGQPAPLMQQQSMNMQGCTPNPWPLSQEMTSPKLGIRS